MPDEPIPGVPEQRTHYMDLGDFVPEECTLRFSINGREYIFDIGETTVDEVFRIIASEQEAKTLQDVQESKRSVVKKFLLNHLIGGESAESLRENIALVPHEEQEGRLSINQLFDLIQKRVKKKQSGGDLQKQGILLT